MKLERFFFFPVLLCCGQPSQIQMSNLSELLGRIYLPSLDLHLHLP